MAMYHRKPITSTGAQVSRVVFAHTLIDIAKTQPSIFAHGQTPESYYISDYQPLIAPKVATEEDGSIAVLGTANSLGGEVLQRYPDIAFIPRDLLHAMILSPYISAGVSVTSYNPAKKNVDGLVSQYGGTTTIKVFSPVNAGEILRVDVPYESELDYFRAGPSGGAPDSIRLVPRVVKEDDSVRLAKQSLTMSAAYPDEWKDITDDKGQASLGRYVDAAADSTILKLVQAIRILTQAGIIQFCDAPRAGMGPGANQNAEFRGADHIRQQVRDILRAMPGFRNPADQYVQPARHDQASLALEADALGMALYRGLMGGRSKDPIDKRMYDQTDQATKNDMEMLRHSIVLASCQDGESNSAWTVGDMLDTHGDRLSLSLMPGVVPRVFGARPARSYSVLESSISVGSQFKLKPEDRTTLVGLRDLTLNHMTKEFTSRYVLDHNPLVFGYALQSAGAGGTIDIKVINGYRSGY